MTQQAPLPGLVIAAPRSGAGKTIVATALLRALARRGVVAQPFKSGPDYIDPGFLAAAAGRTCFNLDTWAMSSGLLGSVVATAAGGAAIGIAEGAMGLFDGAAGQAGLGSSADLAARLGWPVVLVLDVAGQAETAAAVALGCRHYRDDVAIAGVILNRLASERHAALAKRGFERIAMPVFGAVFRSEALSLPERHLGLVQAAETADLEMRLEELADAATRSIDLSAIVRAARPARLTAARRVPLPPPGQVIAVAQDRAFTFLYPHLLWQWRAAGAEIRVFSPLADEAPDRGADAVWLPGGYPELHGGRLASAARFLEGLRRHAGRATPIHGECGGYMVLGRGLIDGSGVRHAMAGLLGLETSFARRKLHLGYRRARLAADCALGKEGAELLGHEFHFATTLACEGTPLAVCADASGRPLSEGGLRQGSVSGTFFHVIDRGGE